MLSGAGDACLEEGWDFPQREETTITHSSREGGWVFNWQDKVLLFFLGIELGLDSEVWGGFWNLSQGSEVGSEPKMPTVYSSRSSGEFPLVRDPVFWSLAYHVWCAGVP